MSVVFGFWTLDRGISRAAGGVLLSVRAESGLTCVLNEFDRRYRAVDHHNYSCWTDPQSRFSTIRIIYDARGTKACRDNLNARVASQPGGQSDFATYPRIVPPAKEDRRK